MSSCILMEFEADGQARDEAVVFRNSWGGAARIWNALYDRWLKNPAKEYDSWLSDNGARLWRLAEDPRLPDYQRAALLATFDGAVIYRHDFARFAADMRRFAAEFPTAGACHLGAWASRAEQSSAVAIAFHHTTVSENPWRERCLCDPDQVCDHEHAVCLSAREDAFSVYAELPIMIADAPGVLP